MVAVVLTKKQEQPRQQRRPWHQEAQEFPARPGGSAGGGGVRNAHVPKWGGKLGVYVGFVGKGASKAVTKIKTLTKK